MQITLSIEAKLVQNGSAKDVKELMERVISEVKKVHSVSLTPETICVGFDRDFS